MKIKYTVRPFAPFNITIENSEDLAFLKELVHDAIKYHERDRSMYRTMFEKPHEKYTDFLKQLINPSQ
jgi:hypothetical protein